MSQGMVNGILLLAVRKLVTCKHPGFSVCCRLCGASNNGSQWVLPTKLQNMKDLVEASEENTKVTT